MTYFYTHLSLAVHLETMLRCSSGNSFQPQHLQDEAWFRNHKGKDLNLVWLHQSQIQNKNKKQLIQKIALGYPESVVCNWWVGT